MNNKLMQIEIKNLRLRTIIGANDWERKVLQDIVITIKFKFDSSKAELSDKLEDTFNYKVLTKRIVKEVEASKFNLLESLAGMVYSIVKEHDELHDVYVHVEKPHALRFCDNVIASKSDNYE
ncbi:MAG: dihydroneopterin aldolase [Bacteroidales bacterium]|nr:dihydroneopterin aldolase [Bacteroidales bacterium]